MLSWPSSVNGTCSGVPRCSSYRPLQQVNTSASSSHLQILKKLSLEDISPQTLCFLSLPQLVQVTPDWRREERLWADVWNRRLTIQEYCWTVKLCVEIMCSVVINVVWVDGRSYCWCDCFDSLVIPIFRRSLVWFVCIVYVLHITCIACACNMTLAHVEWHWTVQTTLYEWDSALQSQWNVCVGDVI